MLGKSLLAILWDEEARIYRLTAYGAGNHISHCPLKLGLATANTT
jgi:hypothetical protein